MLKTTRSLAALILCALTSVANAQTYTSLHWGINRTSSPYQVGINLSGAWYNFGQITSGGTAIWTSLINQNPTGLGYGFAQTRTVTGSTPDPINLNLFNVTSDNAAVAGANFLNVLAVQNSFGGAAMTGGRQGVQVQLTQTAPSNAGNTNRNYVGLLASSQAGAGGDGGTDTGAGALGAYFGGNLVAIADAGATNLLELSGAEVNFSARAGSSMKHKTGWSVVAHGDDAVHGAMTDAGYTLGAQTGAVGLNDGFLFTNMNGAYPVISTGTLMRSTAATVVNGVDLSAVTFTGSSFKSNAFSVDNAGGITATGLIASKAFTTVDATPIVTLARNATAINGGSGAVDANTLWATNTVATTDGLSERVITASLYNSSLSATNANASLVGESVKDGVNVDTGKTAGTYGICFDATGRANPLYPCHGLVGIAGSSAGAATTDTNASYVAVQAYGTGPVGQNIWAGLRISQFTAGLAFVNGIILDAGPTYAYGLNLANGTYGFFQIAGVGWNVDPIGNVSTSLHYLNTSAVPTISACGTTPPAATAGSSNQGGRFTLGTGTPTACTVTFANAYPTTAFCTVSVASNYVGTYYISAQSAAAFTVTLGTGTDSVVFQYSCSGN